MNPAAEAERSLARLGVDCVDLYIIHVPQRRPDLGVAGDGAGARAGVRPVDRSVELRRRRARAGDRVASVPPVVDQVQFSAFEYRRTLLEACERHDVALVGYSSLGTGRHLSDATVRTIADRLRRTPAQVLLRWCMQHGVPVIPKSTHRERIEENAEIFDFALSEEDLEALDALDRTGGTGVAQERRWW